MDKTAMVSFEIGQGLDMVQALEAADLKLNVAIWACLPEYSNWRLVLAARRLDLLGIRDAYGLIHDLLAPAGYTYATTPTFLIFRMNDPFIKALRRQYAKYKDVEGLRIGGRTFGDRELEDAFVYRLS